MPASNIILGIYKSPHFPTIIQFLLYFFKIQAALLKQNMRINNNLKIKPFFIREQSHTSPPKSAWPGVSTMLSSLSFQNTDVTCRKKITFKTPSVMFHGNNKQKNQYTLKDSKVFDFISGFKREYDNLHERRYLWRDSDPSLTLEVDRIHGALVRDISSALT